METGFHEPLKLRKGFGCLQIIIIKGAGGGGIDFILTTTEMPERDVMSDSVANG